MVIVLAAIEAAAITQTRTVNRLLSSRMSVYVYVQCAGKTVRCTLACDHI